MHCNVVTMLENILWMYLQENEAELYPNQLLQIWNKCKSYVSAIDNDNYVHHHQKQQQYGKNNINLSQIQIIATKKKNNYTNTKTLSLPIHAISATKKYSCPLYILDLALQFHREQLKGCYRCI